VIDTRTFLTVLAMAASTYLCRAGGYWLFRSIRPTPFVRALLDYMPGALFVGFTVPALAAGGPQTWVGGAATLVAMIATRNIAVAIVAGTGAAWLFWALA
jgi:uncharacterized membrane protein